MVDKYLGLLVNRAGFRSFLIPITIEKCLEKSCLYRTVSSNCRPRKATVNVRDTLTTLADRYPFKVVETNPDENLRYRDQQHLNCSFDNSVNSPPPTQFEGFNVNN